MPREPANKSANRRENERDEEEKREESKYRERERERLGLIKQFRYGGRRNMRSYPPSFECVEIFMQLPVRHPKRRPQRGERRCSRKRRRGGGGGTVGWKVYRRVF